MVPSDRYPDNHAGSELINGHLFRYCRENKIVFARSKPTGRTLSDLFKHKHCSVVNRVIVYRQSGKEE